MNTVDQRLRVLERDLLRSRRINRTLILIMVTLVCIAGAQGAFTDGPAPPKLSPSQDTKPSDVLANDGLAVPRNAIQSDALPTIEAGRLVLVDRLGRARVRMEVADDGPTMQMLDEHGQKRIEIRQTSRSSGIRLYESDEQLISLQLHHNGDPAQLEIRGEQGSSTIAASGFSVRDASDDQRLLLSLINGNFPMLGLSQSGQQGPPSTEMTARSVKIHNEAGLPLFSVSATDDGDSYVNMCHPDHERSLQISTTMNRGPELAFFTPANKDGAGGLLPRLLVGVDAEHRPHVRAVDDQGRTLFSTPAK